MASKKKNINDISSSGDKRRRDCFDRRVCDDLCEEILRWLPYDEKIKLIAVSKQFNRSLKTVWTRQRVLKFGSYGQKDRNDCLEFVTQFKQGMMYRPTTVLRLTKLLHTFPKITLIEIKYCDCNIDISLLLDLITMYCNKLESIKSDSSKISYYSILDFGLKFGSNIKILEINGGNFNYQHLLKECTSLTSLRIIGRSDVAFEFDGRSSYEFLANDLKKLSIHITRFKPFHSLQKIININKGLTHLDIEFDHSIKELEISDAFRLISELNELVCLRIEFNNGSYESHMAKSFELIAMNCTELKTLYLEVYTSNNNNTSNDSNGFQAEDFFRLAFRQFSSLNKINLHLIDTNEIKLNIDFIENCKQLKHLLVTSHSIPKEFFANVDSVFPRLKELLISIEDQLTDTELSSLSRLANLRTLTISGVSYDLGPITDSGLLSLIDGCNHLNNLSIQYNVSITEHSINSMIQKAIGNPGNYFKYFFYFNFSNISRENVATIKIKLINLNNIEIKMCEYVG